VTSSEHFGGKFNKPRARRNNAKRHRCKREKKHGRFASKRAISHVPLAAQALGLPFDHVMKPFW